MQRLLQRRRFLEAFGAAALLLPARWAAGEETLQPIDDLRALGDQSRRDRLPLLLFFSTPGCPYCLDVRRNYLAPRAREGKAAGVIVREVDITSRRSLTGRDGRPISEMDLAARFNVRVAPVVVLVNGDLVPLAEPLVGIDRSGFYEGYLSSAIDAARAKLALE